MKEKTVATKAPPAVPATRQVVAVLFWAVMGLLAPRVTVYGGLSPFGVGLAAAVSGPGALFTYVATVVGYLLGGDTLFLLRYLAAVTVAAGVRWSFAGVKGPKAALILPPVAGFLGALSAGLAVQAVGGLTLYFVPAFVKQAQRLYFFLYFYFFEERIYD